MPLRSIDGSEALEVIYASLSPVWVFPHTVTQVAYLNDPIIWDDLLEIPPVNKSWVYTQTLVTTYLHDRRFHRPRLNRNVFFAHLAEAGHGETVAAYRDFLMREMALEVPAS